MRIHGIRDAKRGLCVAEHIHQRVAPIVASLVYVTLAIAYFFRWGPIVRHVPSLWIGPGDLGATTYPAAVALAHGNLGAIYQPGTGFLNFPGILIALLPIGALSNAFRDSSVVIEVHRHIVAHPHVFTFRPLVDNDYLGPSFSHGKELVYHPQAFVPLVVISLLLSCTSLFACDALADRLDVPPARRFWLCVAEAVLLWNVAVFWGHPEDAVAVAFALYAAISAIDERYIAAGWLFGLGLAFQPLVVVVLPILLVLGGRRRALGLVIRSIVPAVLLTLPLLQAGYRDTVHALITQPNYPDNPVDHQTPWTALAPGRSGTGVNEPVASGPLRIEALALAVGIGVLGRRWRRDPMRVAWAVAVALALRIYFEPVVDDYYMWPALTIGLAVAAHGSVRRFAVATGLAVVTTVVAQWPLDWLLWWSVNVGGVTAFLVVTWPRSTTRPSGISTLDPPEMGNDLQGRSSVVGEA